jgi:hypothetical protein
VDLGVVGQEVDEEANDFVQNAAEKIQLDHVVEMVLERKDLDLFFLLSEKDRDEVLLKLASQGDVEVENYLEEDVQSCEEEEPAGMEEEGHEHHLEQNEVVNEVDQ